MKVQNSSQVYQSFSAISSTNGSRTFRWHDHRNSIKYHLLWDRQSPSLEWTIIWQKSGNPQTSQTTAEKLAQYVYVSVCMLLYVCASEHVVELLSALQCMTAQFMTDPIACKRSVYGIILLIVKNNFSVALQMGNFSIEKPWKSHKFHTWLGVQTPKYADKLQADQSGHFIEI